MNYVYVVAPLQRLHQEFPDATLRMVRQCGHLPHVEKPREAVKYVLEFLERDKTKKLDRASLVTSALAYVILSVLLVVSKLLHT
jgi:hypothetical protein